MGVFYKYALIDVFYKLSIGLCALLGFGQEDCGNGGVSYWEKMKQKQTEENRYSVGRIEEVVPKIPPPIFRFARMTSARLSLDRMCSSRRVRLAASNRCRI